MPAAQTYTRPLRHTPGRSDPECYFLPVGFGVGFGVGTGCGFGTGGQTGQIITGGFGYVSMVERGGVPGRFSKPLVPTTVPLAMPRRRSRVLSLATPIGLAVEVVACTS